MQCLNRCVAAHSATPTVLASFEAIHGLAHPGIWASFCLLVARFAWKAMRRDIKAWAAMCERLGITHQPTTSYHLQANG